PTGRGPGATPRRDEFGRVVLVGADGERAPPAKEAGALVRRQPLGLVEEQQRGRRDRRRRLALAEVDVGGAGEVRPQREEMRRLAPAFLADELDGVAGPAQPLDETLDVDDRQRRALLDVGLAERVPPEVQGGVRQREPAAGTGRAPFPAASSGVRASRRHPFPPIRRHLFEPCSGMLPRAARLAGFGSVWGGPGSRAAATVALAGRPHQLWVADAA